MPRTYVILTYVKEYIRNAKKNRIGLSDIKKREEKNRERKEKNKQNRSSTKVRRSTQVRKSPLVPHCYTIIEKQLFCETTIVLIEIYQKKIDTKQRTTTVRQYVSLDIYI